MDEENDYLSTYIPDWKYSVEETPKMGESRPEEKPLKLIGNINYCYICGRPNGELEHLKRYDGKKTVAEEAIYQECMWMHLTCYKYYVKS